LMDGAIMRHQHLGQKQEHDKCSQQPGQRCKEKSQPHAHAAVMHQQIAHAAKPGEEGHQRKRVEDRNPRRSPVRSMTGMNVSATKMKMKLSGQMQIEAARDKRDQAQRKSEKEANQIKKFPVHEISPLFAVRRRAAPFSALASGLKTCSRRS